MRAAAALLVLAALAAPAAAGDIVLEWRYGAPGRTPMREVVLSRSPPAGCTPRPEFDGRYGAFLLAGTTCLVASKDDTLWMDRNGDGRLDEDPDIGMETGTGWDFDVRFRIAIPGRKRPIQPKLEFRRRGPRLYYRHDAYLRGEVVLAGRLRPFLLLDGNADLRFDDPKTDKVCIDLDGDGRTAYHRRSHELWRIAEPFGVAGEGFAAHVPSARTVVFRPVETAPAPARRHWPHEDPPPPVVVREPPAEPLAELLARYEQSRNRKALARIAQAGTPAAFTALADVLYAARSRAIRIDAVRCMGYPPFARFGDRVAAIARKGRDVATRVAALDALHAMDWTARGALYASLLREGEEGEVLEASARNLAYLREGQALVDATERLRDARVYEALRRYVEGGPPASLMVSLARRAPASLRAQALRDLFAAGRPDALELARAAIASSQETVAAAIMILGAAGDPESVGLAFANAARAPREARRLLGLLKGDEVVEVFAKGLAADDIGLRGLAADLLALHPAPAAGRALVARVDREPDPVLRRRVWRAALHHREPRVVARLLSGVRGAEAARRLLRTGLRYPAVRMACAQLLQTPRWEDRVLALDALEPTQHVEVGVAVAHCLGDRVWQVRLTAAEALQRIRVKEVIGPLIAQLEKERNARVRAAIAAALQRITGERLRDFHQLWRKWFKRQGKSFVVPDTVARKKDRAAPGERKSVATFYGIPVVSDRIIFVIDQSGSMQAAGGRSGQNRLEVAVAEILAVVAKLENGARINVISFHSGTWSWRRRLTKLSASTRSSLARALKNLRPGGATHLYDGLEEAFADKEVDTIYLLSDGMPSGGKMDRPAEITRAINAENKLRRIILHCVAIGYDSRLLRQLASANGGRYEQR